MYIRPTLVKSVALALIGMCLAWAAAGDAAAPKPHVIYFYNPNCRMCTKTNEVVAAAEAKYKGAASVERKDIADNKTGAESVMYLFELMDELQVPDEGNVTLAIFIGFEEVVNGEKVFTPKRALIEGENIIEKLDAEIADFLAKEGKGGTSGINRPASFFFRQSASRHPAS